MDWQNEYIHEASCYAVTNVEPDLTAYRKEMLPAITMKRIKKEVENEVQPLHNHVTNHTEEPLQKWEWH